MSKAQETEVDSRGFTAAQRRYIETLADPAERRTQEDIARELNVTRAALYKWRSLEGFWSEVNKLIQDGTEQRMPRIWKSLLDKGLEGSVSAMRLLFQLRGELIDKHEVKADLETEDRKRDEILNKLLEKLDMAAKNIARRKGKNDGQ